MEKHSFFQNEANVSYLICFFTLLPFVLLSFYNVPIGDDFMYAKSFIDNGFLGAQLKWFNDWSGRYVSSMAIATLNPLSYHNLGYAFILPLSLIFGIFFSFKQLIKNAINTFNLPLNSSLLFALTLFFYINYLPDFGETFYWYAGAFTYQLPIVFFLLYLNCLINLFKTNRSQMFYFSNFLFASFCLIIILGSNEVMVVYTVVINAIVGLLIGLYQPKKILKFLPLFVLSIGLAIFMLTAPGNFARASLFQRSDFHLIKAIVNTVSRSGFVLSFWFFSLFLLMLFISGIGSIKMPEFKFLHLKNNKKGFWIAFGIIFLWALASFGVFPSIYTTNWIPKRAYTSIFFVFILFGQAFFVIAINKIEILRKINEKLSDKSFNLILIVLMVFTMSINSNVMKAYSDLGTGKAKGYHKQVTETYKMLRDTDKDTVYVQELLKKPEILPIRWPEKHNRLANTELEEYFGLKRIELE